MKKFTTTLGAVALLLVGFSAPAHAWFFKTNADIGPKNSYNRSNSHNVSGNVQNSVMGPQTITLGHHGGNSSGAFGKKTAGINIGGIQGNKNYVDMSISGNSFILGDQKNESKSMNFNSGNSVAAENSSNVGRQQ